jgi:hypothetical protein
MDGSLQLVLSLVELTGAVVAHEKVHQPYAKIVKCATPTAEARAPVAA